MDQKQRENIEQLSRWEKLEHEKNISKSETFKKVASIFLEQPRFNFGTKIIPDLFNREQEEKFFSEITNKIAEEFGAEELLYPDSLVSVAFWQARKILFIS